MMKSNRLYTVNKWNRKAFMPKPNLFWEGGSTGSTGYQIGGSNPFGTQLTQSNTAPYIDWGNSSQRSAALGQTKFLTNNVGNNKASLGQSNQLLYQTLGNKSGSSGNSGGGSGAGWMAAAQTAGSVGMELSDKVGQSEDFKRGLWDRADPVHYLAKGRESEAGNALGDAGVATFKASAQNGNWQGMLVGAGLKIVGGLTNAAFGTKTDKERLERVNRDIEAMRNFRSTANNYDDLSAIGSLDSISSADGIYEGGWFSGGKARRKQEALREALIRARGFADRSIRNNAQNIGMDQVNNALANYSAFGGPLEQIAMNSGNDGMSAIDYGFMSDYLTAKRQQNDIKNRTSGISPMPVSTFGFGGCLPNAFEDGGSIHIKESNEGKFTEQAKRAGMGVQEYASHVLANKEEYPATTVRRANFARNAKSWKHSDGGRLNGLFQDNTPLFALGGDLQTNGSDFTTGLSRIDAGKSHSENPYGGVQVGVDQEGIPNLVEEKETIFNDYVYSNRIKADEETKQRFHLPKKSDLSFADISKKLEKEAAERPNDAISRTGLEAQMAELAEQQERQKQEMEAQRAKEAFEALSPEEQTAVMQKAVQQEQALQQQTMEQEALAQQETMPEGATTVQPQMADGSEANIGQEPQMNCLGGKINRFDKGGQKNAGTWKKGTSAENWNRYTRNGLRDFLLKVNDDIASAETDEEKNRIRENAIKTVRGIQQAYSEAYQNNLTPSEMNEKVRALQKAFQDAGGNAYFGDIAENINLPRGHNTEDTEDKGWVDGLWGPRTSIRNWGSTEYGDDYDDIRQLAKEAGLTYAPGQYRYGDNTLYELGMARPDVAATAEGDPELVVDYGDAEVLTPTSPNTPQPSPEAAQGELGGSDLVPKYRPEWMRYAGLFGPAVGLGLMGAGVGRPDTSGIDAAIATGSGPAYLADYQPLGNYLTYRPLDIWYEQNRLNANARATDRAILNSGSNQGSKMAGLLASGYNDQIASGNLFRQAQEYNDALRKQVAGFNRETDQFNAEAYNRNSQFNADARNRARQYSSSLAMQGAAQKMAADADWYNSLYGNISGLFKGLSDLGTENKRENQVNWMLSKGLFGTVDPNDPYIAKRVKAKEPKAKGGRIRKRGMTF